jgi:glycosyltransferase involved in cell wall biosynthesis
MRILFILTQDLSSPGGLGRYFPIAKEMVKLGNEIFILALHPDFYNLEKKHEIISGVNVQYIAPMHVKKAGNIKSYYPPIKLIYLAVLATIKLIQASWKIPVDIVHIGKPHPMNGIAGLVKGWQKNQVYVDCDDDEESSGVFKFPIQRKIVSWFEKEIPLRADFITTNTHYTKNRLQNLGINPNRIIFLSSGVDMDRFHPPDPSTIQNLRIKNDITSNKIVSYIGSLSLASHPINLLLEAFEQVLREEPKTKLMIVGGGDAYYYLQDQVNKIGISRSVIFTGHVPANEVVNYYYLSDMVIDPVFENRVARGRQPLKLFECWACGVPYISADVGDRSKILGDPPAGLLTEPGDAISLSKSIISLLNHPEIADKIRALGFKRVQNYTWAKIALGLQIEYFSRLNDDRS